MNTPLALASLITDWGGFEKFVARIHETGDVEVEHNVQLPAKSGGTYQIDVLVRSKRSPYTYLTIIECKYWNHPVGRDIINALANVKDDVAADKAVCFTTKGFQSGAKQVAAHRGVDLFVITELVPDDWSLPGRVIDLILQVCVPTLSPVTFPGCVILRVPPFDATGMQHSDDDGNKMLYRQDGTTKGSVTKMAEELRGRAWDWLKESQVRWAADGVHYAKVPIRGTFEGGSRFFWDRKTWHKADAFECEIILEISQSRFVYDRAQSEEYAVVVENYVRDTKYMASRKKGAAVGQIVTHGAPSLLVPKGEVLQNGSIIRVMVDGWGDYEEARSKVAEQVEVEWPKPQAGTNEK